MSAHTFIALLHVKLFMRNRLEYNTIENGGDGGDDDDYLDPQRS